LIAPGHGSYKVKFTKGELEATVTLESHSKPFAGTVVTLRKKEAHLEKIWITGPAEIKAGETHQWQAYGSYSDGTQKELTNQVSWTADPSDILQNMDNGKFKGLKGGEATLKITYEGKSTSKKVTVVSGKPDLVVTDILFSKNNPDEGEPITIKATIKNEGKGTASNFKVAFFQNSLYSIGSKAYGYEYLIGSEEVDRIEPDDTKII
jgi:hypothetical protein